jgi:hypothetical protein
MTNATTDFPAAGRALAARTPVWAVLAWGLLCLAAAGLLGYECLSYLDGVGSDMTLRGAVAAISALAGVVAATKTNKPAAAAAALMTISVLA